MNATLLRILSPQIRDFVQRVESIPGNATVSSWLRTRDRNASVGGHELSQHLVALAVDFVPIAPTTRGQIVAGAVAAGLVAIDEGTHVHVQRYQAGTLDWFIRAAIAAGLL